MEKIKYFLYARKSSEADDKQVASIPSQIDELKKIAQRDGLNVIDILTEEQSAKASGRPIFNKMIARIKKQEAKGILCWKLDRLARNFIDGGQIIDMLQHGLIEHIQTFERSYYPSDNVLMMAVEFGMANQYIRDLSVNIKRGIRNRVERGWCVGLAPIGYLNKIEEKEQRIIIKDPERFELVKKIWNLLLEKHYSIEKLHQIAINKFGLTQRNGKKPCLSKFHHTFTNPFYYGYFRYKGELHKGNHEPMISIQNFNTAQEILHNRMKPQSKTHTFPFTGLIKCGECGAMITAEEKTKHQKNGNVHHYTYYHCTGKKDPNCSQQSITGKELEKQILSVLENIEIPFEFHRWAMKQLRLENEKESKSRNKILENQQKALSGCVHKIDRLIDMRASGEISEEEFSRKRTETTKEKALFEELLKDTCDRVDKWLDMADEVFHFAGDAKKKFETGTLEDKRQILACLGQNLILKDRILTIELRDPLKPIEKMAFAVKLRLEPAVYQQQTDLIYAKNTIWWR
ncbi:MAG: recombinase family protein [Elusimicrobiota bacterium]